jgi:hypothetical protein
LARKKRWEVGEIKDGVCETRFTAFRYFHEYVEQEMLDLQGHIWRGQRCDNWTLDSTIDRLLARSQMQSRDRAAFRKRQLEQFQLAARGRRGANPPSIDDENGWWALGQHHGLCTPLLDWTASPFVAAYFSFIGRGDNQTNFRAIYALHVPSVQFMVSRTRNEEALATIGVTGSPPTSEPRAEIEFVVPLSDENQRLVNQSGLFSRAPDGQNLGDWVRLRFQGVTTDQILRKLLIPNEDREGCLKMLNRMNINHLTLFPDLDGASRFCNLYGEIEKY